MHKYQQKILASSIAALTTFLLYTFTQPTTLIPTRIVAEEYNSTFDREVPYIGEITMFAGTFPPRGWAFCDGQEMDISQYSALFSILGTYYGGDGRTRFNLPDLRGRIPIHVGGSSEQGPGMLPRKLGVKYGAEITTPTFKLNQVKATSGQDITVAEDQQQPISNMQPSLGIKYIIAIEGIYPPRS